MLLDVLRAAATCYQTAGCVYICSVRVRLTYIVTSSVLL